MRVLVTGNLGYIGPVLCTALARSGHEVHGYDCALFARYAARPLPILARQTVADIRDERILRRAIQRCDAVVQLAAISNDPLGNLDPSLTREVNLDATLRVVELSDDRPFVLYSSASVYGVNPGLCTEATAVRPLTLYSRLKVSVERHALARKTALVLRNGTVHGPAPVIRGDLLLNAMVASAFTSREIVLTTTGATMRPVIDVRDLAELTVGLLERGATGLFNAAATNLSVSDAARLVAEMTGARVIEHHDGADPRDYAMDTSKLVNLVGSWWQPRPLQVSVRDLIDYYREIGLTAHDVATRRFHRLAQYRTGQTPIEGAAK